MSRKRQCDGNGSGPFSFDIECENHTKSIEVQGLIDRRKEASE